MPAEPERGDPADALGRVVAAAWRTLGRYHALVAINTGAHTPSCTPPPRPVLGAPARSSSAASATAASAPTSPPRWHLSMLMALIHAASAELRAGRVPDADAEAALVAPSLAPSATNPSRAARA